MKKDIFTTVFETFEEVFEAIRMTELLKQYVKETPIPYNYVILREKKIKFENLDSDFICYDVRFVIGINDFVDAHEYIRKLNLSFLPNNIKYHVIPLEGNDEYLSAKQFADKMVIYNNKVLKEIQKITNYLKSNIKEIEVKKVDNYTSSNNE